MILLCVFFLAGCGYHSPYAKGNNGKGFALYNTIWKNRTNDMGVESLLYQAITDWFLGSKQIRLTTSRDEADLILNGEIISAAYPGLSYGDFDQAKELRAVLTVRFSLEEKKSGKIILESTKHVLEESFFIDVDAVRTRGNKEKALARLADELAEEIYLQTHDAMM